ncbi:sulfite exporter TauE/SafE family protein [Methylobacterium nodulans]|uniref:sulfite exporter TauE/SafE family protein n=1 Tax=Methylobacterium nodulans TaxID=114616 RepID=UPI0005C18878|nr:sulfite exporter TauE/SafE family protein [Methylobacterium nodulans]
MSDIVIFPLCICFAGFVSGLTGFAFALIASGTLLSIKPPLETAALVLICSIISQSISLVRLRTIPPWSTTASMIVPGLFGAPIGIYLLHDLSPNVIKCFIGIFLIGYACVVMCLSANYKIRFGNSWTDGVVGFMGGILGGIAGLSGALPTAWSLVRGWEPRTQRAIYQSFSVVMQVWALGILATYDTLPSALAADLTIAVPILLVSVFSGLMMFARIDQRMFRSIVLLLLAAIGATTSAGALLALFR